VAVPIGDSLALAEAIGWLAGDEDQRLRLAGAAQALALAADADVTTETTRRLYAAVVKAR
jgi:hypothetical protein